MASPAPGDARRLRHQRLHLRFRVWRSSWRGVAPGLDIRLHGWCTVVEPTEEIAACSDSDDNRVLECAVAANAGAIVTGDRALLRLDLFRGIRILNPAGFLEEKPWSTGSGSDWVTSEEEGEPG